VTFLYFKSEADNSSVLQIILEEGMFCHASSVTAQFSVVFHREVSYVDFPCDYIIAFAGENSFSFRRENLLRINLVTLTDE